MRTNKINLHSQRKLIDRRLRAWIPLQSERPPPSGWIKAIRGSLGLTMAQLARRIGVAPSALANYEKSETRGRISIDTLQKAARAMNCKLIYAIVPEKAAHSLEDILAEQAIRTARKIVEKADQSMRLEAQGLAEEDLQQQIRELAQELKQNLDSQIWNQDEKPDRKNQ
jgi:predicted DNA-binding mobile mystery protein A